MLVETAPKCTIDSQINLSSEVKALLRTSIPPLVDSLSVKDFKREFEASSGVELSGAVIQRVWDRRDGVNTIVRSIDQDMYHLRRELLTDGEISPTSDHARAYIILAAFAIRYGKINKLPKKE
jgi:hypothetical protein